jgi:hypothetical protein
MNNQDLLVSLLTDTHNQLGPFHFTDGEDDRIKSGLNTSIRLVTKVPIEEINIQDNYIQVKTEPSPEPFFKDHYLEDDQIVKAIIYCLSGFDIDIAMYQVVNVSDNQHRNIITFIINYIIR